MPAPAIIDVIAASGVDPVVAGAASERVSGVVAEDDVVKAGAVDLLDAGQQIDSSLGADRRSVRQIHDAGCRQT